MPPAALTPPPLTNPRRSPSLFPLTASATVATTATFDSPLQPPSAALQRLSSFSSPKIQLMSSGATTTVDLHYSPPATATNFLSRFPKSNHSPIITAIQAPHATTASVLLNHNHHSHHRPTPLSPASKSDHHSHPRFLSLPCRCYRSSLLPSGEAAAISQKKIQKG